MTNTEKYYIIIKIKYSGRSLLWPLVNSIDSLLKIATLMEKWVHNSLKKDSLSTQIIAPKKSKFDNDTKINQYIYCNIIELKFLNKEKAIFLNNWHNLATKKMILTNDYYTPCQKHLPFTISIINFERNDF